MVVFGWLMVCMCGLCMCGGMLYIGIVVSFLGEKETPLSIFLIILSDC